MEWVDETQAPKSRPASARFYGQRHTRHTLNIGASIEQGCCIDANGAFLGMLGYTREELLGRTSAELSVWGDRSHRDALLRLLRKDGPVQGYCTSFRNRKGALLEVELSAERVSIAGLECLLLLARDLSKENSLERQFQQAQRMEALGSLAAAIAHDVRNQLMVISLNATALQLTDGQNCGRLRQISLAVEKCSTLTRQLLAYSRKQEVRPEPLKVRTIISDFAATVVTLVGPSVKVVTDLRSNGTILLTLISWNN